MKLPLSWIKELVPTKTKPQDLADALTIAGVKIEAVREESNDHIFEFELTTNRGDEQGVLGIAREIAAIENLQITKKYSTTTKAQEKKRQFKLDPGLALAYTYVLFENVKVKPSPEFIKHKLHLSGIRNLANVIDITNYVMLETGIPMHAFDVDKVKGPMNLRASKKGEQLETLDGTKREIPENSIIIEDSEKIFDLAGIMGGKNSEIDTSTNNVLLFVPIYSPIHIRRTSKKMGFRTEASGRYEKKLDLQFTKAVAFYATELIEQETGGKAVSFYSHAPKEDSTPITVNINVLSSRIGNAFSSPEVTDILERLGFAVKPNGKSKKDTGAELLVTPPSFRPDVVTTEDIIEEVSRIYGFNKLLFTLLAGELPIHKNPNWDLKIKQIVAALGFTETITPTLISETVLQKTNISAPTVKLTNPMSSEFAILRPSHLPMLLRQLQGNLANYDAVNLFEFGKTFSPTIEEYELPYQPDTLSAVSTGDLLLTKGVIEQLATSFHTGKPSYKPTSRPYYEAGTSFSIYMDKTEIGEIGSISTHVLKNHDIQVPITFISVSKTALVSSSREPKFKPLPKYPVVKESLAVLVSTETQAAEIEKEIAKASKLITATKVTEVYEGKTIENGKKSVTIEINFSSPTKTLTSEEVTDHRTAVIKTLKSNLSAEIR